MITLTNTSRTWGFHSTDIAPFVLDAGTQQIFSVEDQERTVLDSNDGGLMATIREHVYEHPGVESVYMSISTEPMVDYWIFIEHRDIALVRTLVEDQHKNIIGLFTGTENPPIQIDFHIIYREGREVSELVPSNAFLIPKF